MLHKHFGFNLFFILFLFSTEIISVEQNQQTGVLLKYHTFSQACGQHPQIACLRLHCSSCSMLILSLEVVVVLVELDKVLEASAGCTQSFRTSIGIFRTPGGDRPCSVIGVIAKAACSMQGAYAEASCVFI